MIKNIFTADVTNEIIGRINNLQPTTQRQWGTMDVTQMLAHCNVRMRTRLNLKSLKGRIFS